ncbi:CubicO group peptidase, beta-lactamase class C family [Oceanobacillus limi]|uniref:CubicO group peptidase, beta-lactamase class C family n=1 Tax=Oceanobacillus limi TaxID=930131 RepID=A0A1I0FKW6_9BACI|nr:serine hydrolase domain-containing protein [Oceanobacillus limi]SET58736.1 CubicO group peptidase, beta-lactamase class C family [Oceanobacillus limi]
MGWGIFEEKLYKRMEKEHIPGAAIAVSRNGKIIYEKGFGVQNMDSKEAVNTDTIFGIASVTKSFTALTVLKLAEEGYLNLEDPVVQHIPAFQISGIEPIEAVKVHHLLTHTTGLAPMERKEEIQKLAEHVAYIANGDHPLLGDPGDYFSYCNDTFLLLGAIIEKYTGKLYRRAITEKLLNPLHMNRSTFSLEELEKMDNVSTPYIYDEQDRVYVKQEWPTLGNYEVGGGIRSNVRDLLRYATIYTDQGKLEGNQYISHHQLEKMWQQHVPISDDSYYGYAFKVTPNYHGVTLVEHGGGQPGVSSNFGFIPEEGLAVAVLTNVSSASADEIWLEAVHVAMGLPTDDVKASKTVIELSSESLQDFVGVYASREGTSVEIEIRGQELVARLENKFYALRAISKDTLYISELNRPIRFYFAEDQDAWAIFFGMRMLPRVK